MALTHADETTQLHNGFNGSRILRRRSVENKRRSTEPNLSYFAQHSDLIQRDSGLF